MLYYLSVAGWILISTILVIYVLNRLEEKRKHDLFQERSPNRRFLEERTAREASLKIKQSEWKPADWMSEASGPKQSIGLMLPTQRKATDRSQYQKKFQLLNKSEQVLFQRLKEAAPEMLTLSQVSMSQLFFIGNFRKDGYRQIGEIGRKSIDFLICRPDTSIILAIELNGPTHNRRKQQESDEKKRAALEEAGIPLIVIPADRIPSTDKMREMIQPFVDANEYEPINSNMLY